MKIIASPRWFGDAEIVCYWNSNWKTTGVDAERMAGIPLLMNVQEKPWIEDAHKHGLRTITYIGCMDTFVDETDFEGRSYRLPFRKEDADVLLMNEEGCFVNTLMDGTYRMHRYLICANSTTYVDKMLEYIKNIMDMGGDGLFIDNIGPRKECYGHGLHVGYSERHKTIIAESPKVKQYDSALEKLPIHTHIHPERDHNYAFRQFLLQVRDLVKNYSADNIIIHNGTADFADCADGLMIESYICSWAWEGRRENWSRLKELAKKHEPYLSAGGQIVALSYLGRTQTTVKDDAYFCYAAARLSGFIWVGDDTVKELYQVHLGEPRTPLLSSDGIDYRIYRNGIIAINGEDIDKTVTISLPGEIDFNAVFDLYGGKLISVEEGNLPLSIPASSGRVYQIED